MATHRRFLVLAGRTAIAAVALAAAMAVPGIEPAHADSASEYVIVIKDHRFQPSELTVPAGQRVKLVIDNRDPTPEEFESLDLRREKIVPGGSKATLWVGPLRPGEYGFVGEFNQASAKGKLIAK